MWCANDPEVPHSEHDSFGRVRQGNQVVEIVGDTKGVALAFRCLGRRELARQFGRSFRQVPVVKCDKEHASGRLALNGNPLLSLNRHTQDVATMYDERGGNLHVGCKRE